MIDKEVNLKLEVLENLINFQKVVTEQLRQNEIGLNAVYLLSKEWTLFNLADLNKDVANLIVEVNGFVYHHEYVHYDFGYLTLLMKLTSFKAKIKIHRLLGHNTDELDKAVSYLEKAVNNYMNATMIKIDTDNLQKNVNGLTKYLPYVKTVSHETVNKIANKEVRDYNVKHIIEELVKIQYDLSNEVDDFLTHLYTDQIEQLTHLAKIQELTDMFMQMVRMFKLMGLINPQDYEYADRARLAINSCYGTIDLTSMILGQYDNV